MRRYLVRRQIGRHNKYGVLALDRLALTVSDPTFIKELQHQVEHVWVCLLDLVKENDGVRAVREQLGELPTLFVADVPWRGPDELGSFVLRLVLGHVDPDEPFAVARVDVRRHLLGQLGLAETGRAEEEENERMLVVVPSILTAADGGRYCTYRPVLPHNLLLYPLFQREEPALLPLRLGLSGFLLRSPRAIVTFIPLHPWLEPLLGVVGGHVARAILKRRIGVVSLQHVKHRLVVRGGEAPKVQCGEATGVCRRVEKL
mmetsp:Transcript_10086/g.25923  ORF Transcript_10086/g.25923 Transcript_10086/m.25923 type:complete len:259 (-) Transcript_10086:320-1096(-)